jgi:gliding motility-associated protein GldM
MAGGKETPRQKMIGMMYLVLTALLALNVSKEILNSFVLINDSLVVTNTNFEGKNASQYQAFQLALANDPKKVEPWLKKALAVRGAADSLVKHVELLKRYLIMKTDKLDSVEVNALVRAVENASNDDQRKAAQALVDSVFSLRNVNSKDNYDVPTNIMIGGDEGNPKNGPYTANELKGGIDSFRDRLISVIDPGKGASIINALQKNFDTETKLRISESEFQAWQLANFSHIPLAAVVTNLTKIQTDIRNAESDVVKYLFAEVDASDFKFDTLAAKVIAPNLVFLGDEYSAEIFVAAFSTTQNPAVHIGSKVDTVANKIIGSVDSTSVVVDRGVGMYKVKATSEGLKEYAGIVRVKSPSGVEINYPFRSEYMVMKSGVVVSPTKMNVLYRGVKNPISISVPGVAPENVTPSLDGGKLSPDSKAGKGNYIAEVSGGTTAKVRVSAKIEGKLRPMGDFEFRVKEVPNPVGTIAGIQEGIVSANRLAAAPTVIPKMENFDFELFFRTTRFDLVYQVGTDLITKNVTGASIPADALDQIKRLRKGSRVFIENINAVMLDENNQPAAGVTPKRLAPISLRID